MASMEHGGRKPKEISVTEFCNENVNLYLEEFNNITIILFFIIHEVFREPNSPKISHFFNQRDSSLGRHENAASRKSFKFKCSLSQNQGPILSENLYEY